jgi:peptidoglycan/xylan/chitin deacetylase (PgdA/CDA1 family)
MLLANRRSPRRACRLAAIAAIAIAAVTVGAWLPSGPALAAAGRAGLPATRAQSTNPRVIVTFAWGGGVNDQMAALPMFRKYGMHATYFIPSGLVCMLSPAECRKSSPYLTLDDIRKIAADGNEIGGLSVTHQQLTTMPLAEAKREICDDRANLFKLGFQPTDFAYPFALENPTVEALTRACGYNAGLGAGTLKGAGRCPRCAVAETIPPKNPYNVRTPIEVNSVHTFWIPRTYEAIVTDAQRHGGGWVIFTLHDVCSTNCNLGTTPGILGAVLKWLHDQKSRDVAVETMSQVIGGPVRPPVAGPAPRPLPPPGVANANLAQANGSVPACFQKVDYGGTVASFTYVPGGGPHGSAAETINVTKAGSVRAKLIQSMDLGLCAPSVSPGTAYTAGAWYKSSQQTRIEIYRRTSLGSWIYWTTSPVFPASGSWRHASWNTPAVPLDTTAISFGLTANGVGTISTTDYSLTLAKSYKLLIILGVVLFAILAAGMISRGYYRYNKFMKAEAAASEAEALAEAEPANAYAAPSGTPTQPGKVPADPAKMETEPDKAQRPQQAAALTRPVRAQPPSVRADEATVIMKAFDPSGARKATGE